MKKKIKLALVANTSNFLRIYTLNHIQTLSKNYDLSILCNNASELKKKVPSNVLLVNINFKRGISFFSDIITFFITLFFFIKKRPNFSISFTPKIGFMVAIIGFIVRTPKRVHWFTGQIWVLRKGFIKIFYKFIDQLIFSLCHNVLIDSHSQKKFLIDEKVITSNKSTVLHKGSVGGVNIKKFRPDKKKKISFRKKFSISKNTFVFLYLGRIHKDKGIIELIKAFKIIQKYHDVLLIFVGPLEDNKLKDLFKKNNKILYFGYTNKSENWLQLADILCLPSCREGFGTTIIEAASCGIPALCSKIYGLTDAMIEYKTGFFHKVGNAKDIKNKMQYILNNKYLVKKYGIFAKNRALKDFEQSMITQKLIDFINTKISQNT
jgi:glycosyltransferase involved in cell wall biosynthesis